MIAGINEARDMRELGFRAKPSNFVGASCAYTVLPCKSSNFAKVVSLAIVLTMDNAPSDPKAWRHAWAELTTDEAVPTRFVVALLARSAHSLLDAMFGAAPAGERKKKSDLAVQGADEQGVDRKRLPAGLAQALGDSGGDVEARKDVGSSLRGRQEF